MAPVPRVSRAKGRNRSSAAFDDVVEKKSKATVGLKQAISQAAARKRRVSTHSGKYKCIICDNGFSRRSTVFDAHFALCVRKHGNPSGYAWDEHESCWKKNQGPSGVIAPGLDENNQPFNHETKAKADPYQLAMTQFFVEHHSAMDSPVDAVFGFVEVTDDDAEEGIGLAREPSPASTIVPDGAFFVKGNPILIAQTATRIPEAATQASQTAAKIVHQEIEIPASGRAMPPPGKRVCRDMDARGLLTTYEVPPTNEQIDPRLRKYPNMTSASGFAFNSFRYMIGNPSQNVHHDIHGIRPAQGFVGRIRDETMLKVTNIVIDACRARAAFSNTDAMEVFAYFRNEVSEKYDKVQFKYHPHKPPVSLKTVNSLQAPPLSPALGTPHRVQATTYMVQDVYGLMLQHADTLMQQMQIICLWRDVLCALHNHTGVQDLHILLTGELGEALPMLLEAVEKFGNVF